MVRLQILMILAALAGVSAHTRGGADLEDEKTLASPKPVKPARLLMGKSGKVKNLASGGGKIATPQQQSSGKNGKNSGGKDRNPGGGGGGGGGGGNNGNGQYVAEQHACVPFNDEMQGRASLSLSDDACRTNSCGGGCCRIYHWLICDTGDEMPQLSCVCNENTRPPPTDEPTDAPTDAPTLAPVVATPAPSTLEPTMAVTTSQREPAANTTAPQPTPAPTPYPTMPSNTEPPYVGGAAADSCISGSPHHNNPLFRGFTQCFGASDCPLATECCIHSFCFCGEPDDWTGDCVARIQK